MRPLDSYAKSSASTLYSNVMHFDNQRDYDYEKLINHHKDNFYLQIYPQELQFPFELRKEISCSLQLSNNSDNYVAFKVKTTSPNKYCVWPNMVVVLPRSTCDVTVLLQPQNEAPPYMQCKDKFLIQSIVVNHKSDQYSKNDFTANDITSKMFNQESGYEVKERQLSVAYVAPPKPPLSPVREGEGSDKDLKASNEQVEQQDTSFQIHPKELQFFFELRKPITCSLQLSNTSDNYVAFKVKTTSPKKYYVRPNNGVVLPRSTCHVRVIMQAQKEAPPNMQCNDKFLIQSLVANPAATTDDITREMFNKESGYEVEECKLRVVYVDPPQLPSQVREGSDEDLSARTSDFSDKARELISKLTAERNFAIEKNKMLERQLVLLRRREANNNCHIQ